MRARDAKYAVVEFLERDGWEVYERRKSSPKALAHLVIVDPNTDLTLRVRALHGKRPPRANRMLPDRAREGACDVVAYVDPLDDRVRLMLPLPGGKQASAA